MGYIFQCGIFVLAAALLWYGEFLVNIPNNVHQLIRLDPKSFSFSSFSFSTMRSYNMTKSDIFKRNNILQLLAEVAVKKSEFYFEVQFSTPAISYYYCNSYHIITYFYSRTRFGYQYFLFQLDHKYCCDSRSRFICSTNYGSFQNNEGTVKGQRVSS